MDNVWRGTGVPRKHFRAAHFLARDSKHIFGTSPIGSFAAVPPPGRHAMLHCESWYDVHALKF